MCSQALARLGQASTQRRRTMLNKLIFSISIALLISVSSAHAGYDCSKKPGFWYNEEDGRCHPPEARSSAGGYGNPLEPGAKVSKKFAAWKAACEQEGGKFYMAEQWNQLHPDRAIGPGGVKCNRPAGWNTKIIY